VSSVPLDALERIGGVVCLDFVNTVDPRYAADRLEFLPDYQALLDWAVRAGSLGSDEADRLAEIARHRPHAARALLRRAIGLREALFELFGREPRAARTSALSTLNSELARARRPEIRQLPRGGFRSSWPETRSLDLVLWPIAEAAAELLTSTRLARVRECEGERCGWLFLDTSKAGRRRWCSMADCGNRAKARRRRVVRSKATA
jgi:predicted RNA-binding Zn ribbon-like protein